MNLNPSSVINRFPSHPDNTAGNEEYLENRKIRLQKEAEERQLVVQSFLKDENFNIDQELEGDPGEPGTGHGLHFADSWSQYMKNTIKHLTENKELFEKVKKLSKDKLLLDLGCGVTQRDAFIAANQLGCKAYLGVDKFNVGNPYTKHGDVEKKTYYRKTNDVTLHSDTREPQSSIPAVLLREDMLVALKMLKDNSSVLLFNGIEPELFPTISAADKTREYFTAIAQEIKRVVGEQGYILSSEPIMLIQWGGLKLERDEEFHKECNEHFAFGATELYRIIS